MNFTTFYDRISSGDISVLDEIGYDNPFVNKVYHKQKRKVNLLSLACDLGDQALFDKLTEKNADGSYKYPFLNRKEAQHQALADSIENTDSDLFDKLVLLGANLDGIIHVAANKSEDRLLYIIRNLAEVIDLNEINDEGKTALMIAAESGYHTAVSELLAKKANPHLTCFEKMQTAYDYALDNDSEECKKLLHPFVSPTINLSQNTLLDRISDFMNLKMETDPDRYPEIFTRSDVDTIDNIDGICAGLSSIFAIKNRQNRLKEFKNSIATVCSWDGKSITPEIEFIFTDIIQAALLMQGDDIVRDIGYINQRWDLLFEFITSFKIKNEVHIGTHFDKVKLTRIFESIDFEKRLIHIDSLTHRISISKNDDKYIVYDPNDKSGVRTFDKAKDCVNYIKQCLNFNFIGISIFSLASDNLVQPEAVMSELSPFTKSRLEHGDIATRRRINKSQGIIKLFCHTQILMSPLSIAATFNDFDTVKDIIKNKDLVEEDLKQNQDALIVAAKFSSPELIETLLDNFNYGSRALYKALDLVVKRGFFHLLRKFFARGLFFENPRVKDLDIPVQVCEMGDYSDFETLIELGYKPEACEGNTLLVKAYSKTGGIDFVESLLKSGNIDVNSTSFWDTTFSDYLLINGNIFDYEKLIPYGAKIESFTPNHGKFVTDAYKDYGIRGVQKVQELFNTKIDVTNNTQLILIAAQNNKLDDLGYLIEEGFSNQGLLENIASLYRKRGSKFIKNLISAGAFDVIDVTDDIIDICIHEKKSQDLKFFINQGFLVKRQTLNRCLKTLLQQGKFISVQNLANHATSQGLSVITNSQFIFDLLRARQRHLLTHLLRINIFNDNYRKILRPVLVNSTRNNHPRTIELIIKTVPKRKVHDLINEMIVLAIKIKSEQMFSLYLKLGADINYKAPIERDGPKLSLEEIAKRIGTLNIVRNIRRQKAIEFARVEATKVVRKKNTVLAQSSIMQNSSSPHSTKSIKSHCLMRSILRV